MVISRGDIDGHVANNATAMKKIVMDYVATGPPTRRYRHVMQLIDSEPLEMFSFRQYFKTL
jgi:hypothetical protein